ncbi:MAG: hypothetical protein U1E65_03415 [Myxococcota bacterium]
MSRVAPKAPPSGAIVLPEIERSPTQQRVERMALPMPLGAVHLPKPAELGLTGLAKAAEEASGLALSPSLQKTLNLSSNLFTLTLSTASSPTLGRLCQALEKWESTVGDAKGVMMPRHALALPSPLSEVYAAIQALRGGGAMELGSVADVLPQAMTKLFRPHGNRKAPALGDLYSALCHEVLVELGNRYQQRVVEEKMNPGGFFLQHQVITQTRARLAASFPKLFPEVSWNSADSSRLKDPKFRGTLSKVWKEQVLTGQLSARRFYGDYGLSDHLMSVLREDQAAFPPIERRGGLRRGDLIANTPESAAVVGKFLKAQVEADILVRQSEICARFNQHPDLGKKLGRIDENMVARLRTYPGKVPPMPSSDARLAALLLEVKQAAADPKVYSVESLLARLRSKHPGIKRNWLDRLRERYGDEIPRFKNSASVKGRRTIARTGKSLDERLVRVTLPLQRLAELVLETAPPGATAPMVNAVLDAELKARGYPGLPASHLKIGEFRFLSDANPNAEGLRAINARRVAEVVTEYALAAPKGRTLEQTLADVRRDYPHIEKKELNAYLRLWKAQPSRYPVIAAFANGKEPRRDKPNAPRYLGGWDFQRWASTASSLERSRIEGMTQYLRIPRELELVDLIQKKYGPPTKLAKSRLFWVTHLKADIAPLGKAMLAAGLSASDATIVSSPYGNSDAVRDTMRDLGYAVTVPPLSQEAYAETVKQRLGQFLKDTPFPPSRPVLVLDDGGLVASALYAEGSPYAKWRPYVRIVEQTTGGVELADNYTLEGPMIMAARSKSKEYESKLIAQAVVSKIARRLEASGQLQGQEVTIIGGGFLGRALSLYFAEKGWKVNLAEKNATRAKEVCAASHGKVKHVPLETALKTSDLVLGATSGGTSLPLPMLSLLKDGAVIASASSRRREFDMEGLSKASSKQETLPEPFPHALLPDRAYTLKNRRIVVLGDGWPINHDGDAEGVPPRRFQITDAALLAGVLQAAGLETGIKGPIKLSTEVDDEILAAYRDLEDKNLLGPTESFDPRKFMDLASAVAGQYQVDAPKAAGVPPEDIITAVAKELAFSRESLMTGINRDQSGARAIAVHLVRRFSGVSLSELSEVFGGRTSSALLYAERSAGERIAGDKKLAARVQKIITHVGG